MIRSRFTPTEAFQYYFYWMTERQNIFWARHEGQAPPYTDDPVLQQFKFTNVYRALDRTTQYLLRHVIDRSLDARTLFWRVLLFKHFNRIETWEFLERKWHGVCILPKRWDMLLDTLDAYQQQGKSLYSNAYMLTASFMQSERLLKKYNIAPGISKHRAYFQFFKKDIAERQLDVRIPLCDSLGEVYDTLSSVTTIGPFLAYQYAVDLNYAFWQYDENSFVSCGVGTRRGIDRTFEFTGRPNYEAVIDWVHTNFMQLMRDYGYYNKFRSLPGRWPTKVDLANCFCETDKYLRASGQKLDHVYGKRMKATFKPNGTPIEYVFPKSWNIKL